MPIYKPDKARKDTLARIRRTEAYAEKIRRMYAETVGEITALVKTLPDTSSGTMYSFAGDSLQVQLQVEILLRRLHSVSVAAIQSGVKLEWEKANEASDKLIRSVYRKKLLDSDLMRGWDARNGVALSQFLQRSNKGMNLSNRVWQSTRQLRDEMEVAITVAIGDGTDAQSLSRSIRKYLNDPDLMFRRFQYQEKVVKKDANGNTVYDKHGNPVMEPKLCADGKPIWKKKWKKRIADPDKPGRYKWIDYDKDSYKDQWTGKGYYKSSAQNAMRVARTETNIAYRRADHERWNRLDFVLGQKIQLSNKHPHTDICDKLAGDYPKEFVFDGWHPQCFCYATPILVSPEEMKAMQDAKNRGESYTPKGIVKDYPEGFKNWVEDNVDKITEARKRGTAPYFIANNGGIIDRLMGQDAFTLKGATLKGGSRALTSKMMEEIPDDYIGRTKLTEKQNADLEFLCDKFGLNISKINPMTFKDADSGLSNIFRGTPDYDNNCVSCVLANEMRRRGVDITAGMESAIVSEDIRKCWLTEKDNTPEFLCKPEKLVAPDAHTLFNKLNKILDVPNGRYVIGWDGIGEELGHVLCIERINGKLIFYDPQAGKRDCFWNFEEIFLQMDSEHGLELLRIDNLHLNREYAIDMLKTL